MLDFMKKFIIGMWSKKDTYGIISILWNNIEILSL